MKRVICLLLAMTLLFSLAAISACAADARTASQGADADAASTGEGLVYFDAASAGWESASAILFYISDIENGELAAWGSKKKLGGTKGDNNIWSFDAEGLGVTAGHNYIIIFNNYDTAGETYQLLLDTSCFGDTAVVNPGKMIENPVDSNKSSMEARWTNSSLGPRLQITSIGNVVGETIPANTNAEEMLTNFLAFDGHGGLASALQFNGKDAQTTVDEVAKALGLNKDQVSSCVTKAKEAGATVNWDASKSSLPGGSANAPRVSVEPAVDGLKISWTKASGASWYRVFYKGRNGWTKLSDVKGTSCIDTDVRSGASYTYTVRALSYDRSSYISDYDHSGVRCTYIAAPDFGVSNAEDGVRIKWDAVPGAELYRVFYKSGSGWKKLADTAGVSVIDKDVRSGASYTYTVRCLSVDGKRYISDFRSGKSIKYITAPVFSVSNAEDGVKISWSAVGGASKYRVFYMGRNGWTKLTDTTSTSCIDTDVRSGASYTYTVRCLSADGSSYISNYRDGKSVRYITAPKFSVSNAEDGVKISWSAVGGAEKYRVFYKGRNGWTKLTDTSATSVIDTDVKSGSTYTYTVRCLSADGKSYISNYRDGKSVGFITAPKFSVSNASNGVKISWSAVPGAEKYRVFYKGRNGWTKLTDTSATSVIDTDVKSGKTYTYTVRCLSEDGKSYISNFRDGKSIAYAPAA